MKILLQYVGKHEFSFEIGENANGKQDGHNIWKKRHQFKPISGEYEFIKFSGENQKQ